MSHDDKTGEGLLARLRAYADIAEAGDKPHWAVAMREAAAALSATVPTMTGERFPLDAQITWMEGLLADHAEKMKIGGDIPAEGTAMFLSILETLKAACSSAPVSHYAATPRTDAALVNGMPEDWSAAYLDLSRFARQLERELAEAKDALAATDEVLGECQAGNRALVEQLNAARSATVASPEAINELLLWLDVDCNRTPGSLDLEAAEGRLREWLNKTERTANDV